MILASIHPIDSTLSLFLIRRRVRRTTDYTFAFPQMRASLFLFVVVGIYEPIVPRLHQMLLCPFLFLFLLSSSRLWHPRTNEILHVLYSYTRCASTNTSTMFSASAPHPRLRSLGERGSAFYLTGDRTKSWRFFSSQFLT